MKENTENEGVGVESVFNEDGTINHICTSIMQLENNQYQRFMFVTDGEQDEILKELKTAGKDFDEDGGMWREKYVLQANGDFAPSLMNEMMPTINKVINRVRKQMGACFGIDPAAIEGNTRWDTKESTATNFIPMVLIHPDSLLHLAMKQFPLLCLLKIFMETVI